MEAHKGALMPGMLADFVVLSQDIFSVDVESIHGRTTSGS
jgi:predicted amidohydrolase YtcJ